MACEHPVTARYACAPVCSPAHEARNRCRDATRNTGRASAAPSLTFSADPYPGIHRETWTDANPAGAGDGSG